MVFLHPGHFPHHVRPLPAGLPPIRDRDQGGDEERQAWVHIHSKSPILTIKNAYFLNLNKNLPMISE